jgi:hypothetical protein
MHRHVLRSYRLLAGLVAPMLIGVVAVMSIRG